MRLKYEPIGAVIDLTTICSGKCIFCWRSNSQNLRFLSSARYSIMPFILYRRIIDELSKFEHIKWLSLCGPSGEPFEIAEISDYARYARERNCFYDVVTNTSGFGIDRHNVRELVKSFTEISVSLDAFDKETYRLIHPSFDFERIKGNVLRLQDATHGLTSGAKIKIRFTETCQNKGQYERVLHFWSKFGIEVYYRRVHSFLDRLPEHQATDGAMACNQPKGIINLTVNGELTTCCVNFKRSPVFGTFPQTALKDIWESVAFEKWRASRLHTTCKFCSGLHMGLSQKPK